jgi:hypothetical protein
MNEYPPEYDAEHALEITVGSMDVAWNEDDEVYIRAEETKDKSSREDGYILIGHLNWEDSPDCNYDEDTEYNLERLRNFVLDWKQGINK